LLEGQIVRQLRPRRRLALHPLDRGAAARGQPASVAQYVHAHTLALQLRDFFRDVFLEQIHECGDFGGGTIAVLFGEGKQRQHLDTRVDRAFDCFAHRFHPRPMAERPGQPALARPAAVAVHDDRHVAGNRSGAHQTSMISASLAFTAASTPLRCSSCVFCTSFSACFWSSEETCSVFLIRFIASVRACRMATRPSSANLCTTLTSSLRRSAVSGGVGMRIRLPSFDGVRPRSEGRMPFSTAFNGPLSHGCTVSSLGYGAATLATCVSGISFPYASTRTRSSNAVVALPVRTVVNSRLTASTALSMSCLACLTWSVRFGAGAGVIGRSCRRALRPGPWPSRRAG